MLSICQPELHPEDVPDIIQKLYGLHVSVLAQLDSYDDQNFLVQTVPSAVVPPSIQPDNHGAHETVPSAMLPPSVQPDNHAAYVLKVLNSLDSQKPDVIEAQTKIILHARRAGYPTPTPVPGMDGRYQKLLNTHGSISYETKDEHVVRLFTFIPGQSLNKVALTPHLCYEIGWFAGRLDTILKDFPTDACPVVTSMTRKWNMSQIPRLRDKLPPTLSEEQRNLVDAVVDHFDKQVLAAEHNFSKGLIHSDFNDCNILVSHDCSLKLMPTGSNSCQVSLPSLPEGVQQHDNDDDLEAKTWHEKYREANNVDTMRDGWMDGQRTQ